MGRRNVHATRRGHLAAHNDHGGRIIHCPRPGRVLRKSAIENRPRRQDAVSNQPRNGNTRAQRQQKTTSRDTTGVCTANLVANQRLTSRRTRRQRQDVQYPQGKALLGRYASVLFPLREKLCRLR